MKNLQIVLISAMLTLVFGCTQKETPKIIYEKSKEITNWQDKLENRDNVLHFNSWAELEYINHQVNQLEFTLLDSLSKQKKFDSQRYLLQKIQLEEERVVDEAFKKYVDLSEEAFKKLNLPYPGHTDLYKKYVETGMIAVEEDNDTANVYSLSTLAPDLAGVLNENGVVIVSDTVYQFSGSQIKRAPEHSLSGWRELLGIQSSNPDKGIEISMVKSDSRTPIGWNWTGTTNKFWTSTGNNRRARYTRYGWSNTNTWSSFSQVKYYLHLEAEQRLFGKWKKRNSYRPLFTFNGNWSGSAEAALCSNGLGGVLLFQSQFPVATGVTASPMVNRVYQGNDGYIYLHPHTNGYWQIGSPFCWKDPFNISVPNINIHGTVNGGSSGYVLTGG